MERERIGGATAQVAHITAELAATVSGGAPMAAEAAMVAELDAVFSLAAAMRRALPDL